MAKSVIRFALMHTRRVSTLLALQPHFFLVAPNPEQVCCLVQDAMRSQPPPRSPSKRLRRWLRPLLLASLAFWLLLSWRKASNNSQRPGADAGLGDAKAYVPPDRPQQFLLHPLTESTPQFCRTLFALLFTGYPNPILVSNGYEKSTGVRQIAKDGLSILEGDDMKQ